MLVRKILDNAFGEKQKNQENQTRPENQKTLISPFVKLEHQAVFLHNSEIILLFPNFLRS